MILRGKSPEGGFCFDIKGQVQGRATKEFYTPTILDEMQACTQGFPALKLRMCGSCHEGKIAKIFPEEELLTVLQNTATRTALEQSCFCYDRTENELCAHRNLGRPNPLGKLIPRMDRFGILDHDSWNEWHEKISEVMLSNDRTVGDQRYRRPVEAIEEGKREQLPIAKEIAAMRRLLKSLLGQAIQTMEGT